MKQFSMFFRPYTLLTIIFFSLSAAQTTDTWHWLNPKPTGSVLLAVRFIDNNTGYAVGRSTIIKTTDGGTTWKYLIPIPFEPCAGSQGLSFPEDAQTGYVVGSGGHIIKTTDGGATWQNQSSGTSQVLRAVQFPVDAQTGYIVGGGGTILKTTDGGATWQHQSIGTTEFLISMHFPVDDQTGYVVEHVYGPAAVWKTTDGGASWAFQASIDFITSYIYFIDVNTGFISGQGGEIYKTTDGGTNWVQLYDAPNGLCKIWFVDDQIGYVAGLDTLLKTTDAGATWAKISLGTHVIFAWDIHFPVNGQIGYVVGSKGHIWKTTNAGATWIDKRISLLPPSADHTYINSVHFVQNTGYVVGDDGIIMKTTDAGETWSSLPPYVDEYDRYQCVWSIDAQTTFIGAYLHWLGCGILKTTDGGATWTRWPLNNYANFIQFVDNQTGYCAWNNGVLKTTDAGETWVNLSGVASEARCLHFPVDDQIGYTVHTGGRIYKTTDGGATWVQQSTPTSSGLESVYFFDANTGYAGGWDATILKTTNGGTTWFLQPSGLDDNYRGWSICFPANADTGYIASDNGYILKTTDGGSQWVMQSIGSNTFLSICFAENSTIGYIVGDDGAILKLGGEVGTEEKQANISIQTDTKLNIEPNPFVFYATVSGHEEEIFALYDISGRQVGTCRGNRLGEGLCAGVYFVIPEHKNLKPVRIVKVR